MVALVKCRSETTGGWADRDSGGVHFGYFALDVGPYQLILPFVIVHDVLECGSRPISWYQEREEPVEDSADGFEHCLWYRRLSRAGSRPAKFTFVFHRFEVRKKWGLVGAERLRK